MTMDLTDLDEVWVIRDGEVSPMDVSNIEGDFTPLNDVQLFETKIEAEEWV